MFIVIDYIYQGNISSGSVAFHPTDFLENVQGIQTRFVENWMSCMRIHIN